MQVIYALPFLLASTVAGAVCLLVPRFRRYTISAAVAPVAFAVCSIVGLFASALVAEYVGIAKTIDDNIAVALLIYCFAGLIGAVLAATFANRLQRRLWTGLTDH